MGVDPAFSDLVRCPIGHQEVIDAPPGIPCPGVAHVAPPGIFYFIRMQISVGIDEAAAQQLLKGFPLLIGEAGASPVCLGILQIYLACGHVQVAADDDRFSFCGWYI